MNFSIKTEEFDEMGGWVVKSSIKTEEFASDWVDSRTKFCRTFSRIGLFNGYVCDWVLGIG